MVDLLGPADAGSINTLTTTSDVTSPVAGDTWFQDCAGGVSGTGTDEVAKYLNRYLQQLRVAIRAGNVPLSNAYDAMLAWAIESGFPNFITGGVAGGTANALTGSSVNSPTTVPDGTVYRGFSSTPNTGAATYNHQGLGALPILTPDGQALSGGEINGAFELMKAGSNWYLMSASQGENPFVTEGVGAVVVVEPAVTPNSSDNVGTTSTWVPGVGGVSARHFIGHADYNAADHRWQGVSIPGTWVIQTQGGTDYAVLVRIE